MTEWVGVSMSTIMIFIVSSSDIVIINMSVSINLNVI